MDTFHLKGEDDSFKSRINDIYSTFDIIKSNSQSKLSKESSSSRKRTGKDSSKLVEPGYKTEPSKWVKYTLETTAIADDRQNTQAALSFLHELSKRTKCDKTDDKVRNDDSLSNVEEEMSTNSKIAFKKPLPFTMSEHVVGKAKLKLHSDVKSDNQALPSFDKVELDHLDENLSAVEYQADIEAKLDEKLQLQKNSGSTYSCQDQSDSFKSRKLRKTNRNLRQRK